MNPSADLYARAFGLRERPFTLLPDPDFLYWSPGHRQAYTVLRHGLHARAPITVVTGEIGAGKTTLVRHLLDAAGDEVTIGLLSNTLPGRGSMLGWALNALGVTPPAQADDVARFEALQERLVAVYAAGGHVALVIDEAQNLSRAALEELRMLTNINSGKDELLQLVLVGQPELGQTLARPELRPLAQRVAMQAHVGALDREGVAGYVAHRLAHAGAARAIFSPAAIGRVHAASGGIPRLVNKICDVALLSAAGEGRASVDAATVDAVLRARLFPTTFEAPREAAE